MSPLDLVSTQELMAELEKRSHVTVMLLLQKDSHASCTVHRTIKWRDSTIFEAIGILTLAQTTLHGLIQQASTPPE